MLTEPGRSPRHPIPASDTTMPFQDKWAGTWTSLLGLKLWNPSFHSLVTSFAALWKHFPVLSARSHTKVQSSRDKKAPHLQTESHLHLKFLGGRNNLLCPAFELTSKYKNIHTVIHSVCSNIIFMKHSLLFSFAGTKTH